MPMPVRSLAELQLNELIRNKEFTPSPTAWEEEVLYFLLVDRFSDGNEKGYRGTPPIATRRATAAAGSFSMRDGTATATTCAGSTTLTAMPG
jgi:hypothetical protein